MTLSKLKLDYKNGIISKQEYIREMFKIHKCLFEYSEFIPKVLNHIVGRQSYLRKVYGLTSVKISTKILNLIKKYKESEKIA